MEQGSQPTSPSRFRNRILARLVSEDRQEVLAHVQPVELPRGTVLRGPSTPGDLVFFVEEGMASSTAFSQNGMSIEVGMIGREGLVGISTVLGHSGWPHRTMMQLGGRGFSLPREVFRTEFARGGAVAAAVHDFIYAQLAQAAQTALCNRLHATEPRLARWLLTASDIIDSPTLQFTQEFLAEMIGTERSSATIAAGTLKNAGLIDYRRGVIHIENRPMLEDSACECYRLLRDQYTAIYGDENSSVG